MRTSLEGAKLILGATTPSLESIYLARKGKIKYQLIPRKAKVAQVKIIDTKYTTPALRGKRGILSKYLEDGIAEAINEKRNILLFLNRKGFSTFASCQNCAIALKCPRCNINLVYHFKDNTLACHYCNFKMPTPQICPNCNAGYIRYWGTGTEKLESELARIFPQARIKRLDDAHAADAREADIFIATESIVRGKALSFDLVAALAIDSALNRADLRSAERTFSLLFKLSGLTKEKLIIQTHLSKHHCLRALESNNFNIFYDEELSQRKQLKFPPYQHFALVKVRGKNEGKVQEVSRKLFEKLKSKNKSQAVISVNPAQPLKLRGNFYWQILTRGKSAKMLSRFLKISLKDFPHSDIIITVDIDPI